MTVYQTTVLLTVPIVIYVYIHTHTHTHTYTYTHTQSPTVLSERLYPRCKISGSHSVCDKHSEREMLRRVD